MKRTLVVSKGNLGLLWALRVALWWHRGDRAFENLHDSVLDAKSQILEARPARPNLVDLVDENDAPSGHI
jgi:hypothetical protein